MAATVDERIAAVRSFNRFYTRRIGVLREGLLRSEFSLAQARVLYELANPARAIGQPGPEGAREGVFATSLVQALELDPGYLSRILRGFEKRGLIVRRAASEDRRRQLLQLTAAGRAAFRVLDRRSKKEVQEMLAPLSEPAQTQLLGSMATLRKLLEPEEVSPGNPGKGRGPIDDVVLRPHRPGDIGWVISRHGALYAQEFGWTIEFEAMVAEIGAKFIREFDPGGERAWIAQRGETILGSVFVVRQSKYVAKLRLMYLELEARGLGLGRRMVAEAIAFARARGYRRMVLWTNAILLAARHLYREAGFVLVREEHHHSFGKDLVGETWELEL